MFWESIETVKERTLQQMVKDPATSLDDILNHDYCFQELRVESPYLVEYFTNVDILEELLNRSIFFRPSSDTDPLLQYKVSPRALGVLTLGCKSVNNAVLSNPKLVERLLKYLEPSEDSYANDVTTGFYKRLFIAMLITFETPENKFLDALENSNFMDLCFNSLHYGAIAELLVRVPTHCTNLDFQKRIFEWYAKAGVAKHLLSVYNSEATMEVLENAGFIWSEFDEMQLRHLDTSDAFKKELYSVEMVKGLAEQAFSSVDGSSPMLINYIAPILVSFIEMNHVPNEPGYKAFPDLYMREPTLSLEDPDYAFQSEIVRHAQVIMRVILKAFESPISAGHTLTAVSCLRIIRALTNSNHKETNMALAEIFGNNETSIVKLLEYSARNPTSSICNNQIMAIVAHIIFSEADDQHALVDSLFKTKPTIIGYIIEVLKKHTERTDDEPYLQFLARQSFFLKIGEFINNARLDSSHLNELIQSQQDAEQWQDLTNSVIHIFSESNKTYSLGTTGQFNQTACDNLLEIDEVAAAKGEEVPADTDEITAEKNLRNLGI